MEQLYKDAFGKLLFENSMNEASMAADIATWEPLIFPLIHKIYPNSLIEQIASVQPTKSPISKISYLNAVYTGTGSNIENGIHWTNSRLLTLPASSQGSFVVGNTYTIDTTPPVDVKVFYGEITNEYQTVSTTAGMSEVTSVSAVPMYWNILVAAVTGTLDVDSNFKPENVINSIVTHPTASANKIGSETILYSTTNKNTIKKVFKEYSNLNDELNANMREVNFEPATKTVETKSRKIRSKFSQEKLQDLKAIYDEKGYDIVAEAVANEIRQEIDREIIQFLKESATPMLSDINLPLSLGASQGGGLDAVTYDVYGSIYLAAEEIVKATKRNRTMFVLADSATCAFLLLNPLHSEAKAEESNPYKVGKIGAYDLFCDPYSTEHYVLVGYNFVSSDKHDSGLYFTPYSTTIHEVTSGDGTAVTPFSQNFMVMNRYGYTIHPQDSGGYMDGTSDFFRIFAVNFSYNGVTIPNFPEQFRR
jgi:hypothetical protein